MSRRVDGGGLGGVVVAKSDKNELGQGLGQKGALLAIVLQHMICRGLRERFGTEPLSRVSPRAPHQDPFSGEVSPLQSKRLTRGWANKRQALLEKQAAQ